MSLPSLARLVDFISVNGREFSRGCDAGISGPEASMNVNEINQRFIECDLQARVRLFRTRHMVEIFVKR